MKSAYARDVAAKVHAEMARQRMSQTAIAERMAVSQAYVSRRLTGEVAFDLVELDLVASILGVPVEQFVARDTATPRAHPMPTPSASAKTPPGRRGRKRRRPLEQLERGE